jgi:hypothetical protein
MSVREDWSGVWRLLAGALAGMVVSGVSFFLLEGRGHVAREDLDATIHEMREYVNEHSPYIKDKGTIFTRLENIDTQQTRILSELEAISSLLRTQGSSGNR